ncbi:MAG: hypothetical protein JXM75_07925 [Chromatiaceae bacterium]|nr:hypothetical protein [Chromatiaceae bacterium]
MTDSTAPNSRLWSDLSENERTALLIEHGRDLDALPPTCSLDTKRERLRRWLLERGVIWTD